MTIQYLIRVQTNRFNLRMAKDGVIFMGMELYKLKFGGGNMKNMYISTHNFSELSKYTSVKGWYFVTREEAIQQIVETMKSFGVVESTS